MFSASSVGCYLCVCSVPVLTGTVCVLVLVLTGVMCVQHQFYQVLRVCSASVLTGVMCVQRQF